MAKKLDPTPIIVADWKVGTKRYSKKQKDSKTGKAGSAYYFIPTGSSQEHEQEFKTDDGTTTSITYERVFFGKPEERDSLPCLRFNGAKPVLDLLPDTVMVNCNPDFKGKPYMPISVFNDKIKQGLVVTDATSLEQMDTSTKNQSIPASIGDYTRK